MNDFKRTFNEDLSMDINNIKHSYKTELKRELAGLRPTNIMDELNIIKQNIHEEIKYNAKNVSVKIDTLNETVENLFSRIIHLEKITEKENIINIIAEQFDVVSPCELRSLGLLGDDD